MLEHVPFLDSVSDFVVTENTSFVFGGKTVYGFIKN